MNSVRVMSFNLRGAHFEDGEHRWERRAQLTAQLIRRYAPDLIGFQEFEEENLLFYREHLGEYDFELGPHYNDSPPHQHPAIAWSPDRLRLTAGGGFWLSETPDRHSQSWGTECTRAAHWAIFQDIADGRCFVHLNTHLDHISEPARLGGAQLIASSLPLIRDALPAIITGDFNCVPCSPAHAALVAAGYRDTDDINPPSGPQPTFHGFLGPAYTPLYHSDKDRIDWVLADGFTPSRSQIIRDAEPPRYPSDHYPVIADLSW